MSRLPNEKNNERQYPNDSDARKTGKRVQINGMNELQPKDAYPLNELRSRPSSVLEKKKPFLRVTDQGGVEAAAKDVVFGTSTWIAQAPDALVTFITGNTHFDQWRRDDFRSALQGGFIKLMNSLNLVIFDDGLHYGLSKILGDVAREEEMLKVITTSKGGRPPLIGMIPVCRLQEQDHPGDLGRLDDTSSIFTNDLENVVKFPLNESHSHRVLLGGQSYREAGLIRVAMEKKIQEELSIRVSAGNVGVGRRIIPMVAFLFQGELEDLQRIKAYLENGVPVVVMEGCGGLGDVIAAAVDDSAEMDGNRLQTNIDQKLHKTFPTLQNSEHGSFESLNLVLDILRLSQGENGTQLISVINCRIIDTFANLNSAVLKNAINSSTAHASPELFSSFLSLAVKCNKPDIATSMLLSKAPWSSMELPSAAFEMALLLPGREKFIDLFLLQQYPVRNYLSHLKLLKLFREARDQQFFPEHVWEGILRYNLTQPIGPDFIIIDLNKLIARLSGIHNYINVHELSSWAFGERSGMDANNAERKAMNALLVFGVLFNRPNLVKILIKYASEPLLQALFAESLFHGLYRNVSHVAMSEVLHNMSNQFAQIATDLLDKAVADSPVRGHDILTRRFTDFNNKTPLEIAYDTNNKQFIAHTNVQSWLDQYYFNFIKVKGNMDNLKLFVSALFIFPMYLWLSFPRLKRPGPAVAEEVMSDATFRPKHAGDVEKVLLKVKRIQSGEQAADHSIKSLPNPPFWEMLSAVWAAPAVRFYTWHLFYWLFIILICVDIMLPACRFIGVDIAVFVLTISMWCDLAMRTLFDVQRFRRIDWTERSYDLVCQTVFNILFFLYRIAPYRYDHPFAGRVILAFGILYYCYRVWGWFYYMEKTIGPLIRTTVQMFTLDLSRWIVLIAPFLIATSLIFMGVINPDWPATGDDWRHMIYRGIFNLFGAFGNELEYTPPCEATRTKNNNQPPWIHKDKTGRPDGVPADRCWSGDYDSYSCPTVSFWSYFFVIQYYVFLKLGMGNMLTAFYVTRNLSAARLGPAVWKYHRCRIILDYAGRTSLPPPFYALGYLYMIVMQCIKPKGFKGSYLEGDVASTQMDDSADAFTYWKGLSMEYFRGKEMQESMAVIPQQQLETLTGIQDDLTILSRKLASADRKVLDVEEATTKTGYNVKETAAQLKQSKAGNLSDVAQPWPHKLSRMSPYPGSKITRFFVPQDKVDWKENFEDYEPKSFTKGHKDSSDNPALDDLHSLKGSTSKASSLNLQSLEGYRRNQVDTLGSNDIVSQNSWITMPDKTSVEYRTDNTGSPQNPFGRTGLRGRGSLQRLGPNHKIYMLITTRVPGGFRYIVHKISGKVPTLPQSFINRNESEFAVACLIVEAFLFDSNILSTKDLNLGDIQSLKALYDVVDKSLKTRLSSIIENVNQRTITLRELYRGYCDSTLNTDNAWLEAVVFHLNIPSFGIDRFTNYKWQVYSADTGLAELDGAIVRQLASEYAL